MVQTFILLNSILPILSNVVSLLTNSRFVTKEFI